MLFLILGLYAHIYYSLLKETEANLKETIIEKSFCAKYIQSKNSIFFGKIKNSL